MNNMFKLLKDRGYLPYIFIGIMLGLTASGFIQNLFLWLLSILY